MSTKNNGSRAPDDSKATPILVPMLSPYVWMWSAANLLRLVTGFAATTALGDAKAAQPALFLTVLILLAALAPARPALFASALVLRGVTNLAKGASLANSQHWATQMDATLFIALCLVCVERGAIVKKLTPEQQRRVVDLSAPIVRAQMVIYYSACAFWKMNTSFEAADYSCASILVVLLMEYMPPTLLPDALLRAMALVAPAATLFLEWAIPVLQATNPASPAGRFRRLNSLLMLAFHLIITLTPPPLNIGSFGVTTCTRLFFFLPHATARAVAALGSSPWLGAAAVGAAAALVALTAPLHASAISTVQGSGLDLNLAYFGALAVPLLYAVWIDHQMDGRTDGQTDGQKDGQVDGDADALQGHSEAQPEQNAAKAAALETHPASTAASRVFRCFGFLMVCIALVYAYALPVLGLQERGGCLMFSQLRLHAGSNHRFLPTALLQRALRHAHPSNAFAGGVVRLEETNISWVANSFAEHLNPRGKQLLARARVPSQLFFLVKATTDPLEDPAGPIPRFYRHTLSNLGLRRLVSQASALREPFRIEYVRLDDGEGGEGWRAHGAGVRVRVQGGGGDGDLVCTKLGHTDEKVSKDVPCDEAELGLISPESGISTRFTYFLRPQPNPIVEDANEEMHCVTFG